LEIIETNIKSIIGRIVVAILLIVSAYLIFVFGILSKESEDGRWVFYIIGSLLILIFLNIIVSFFGVLKIKIDKSSGQLVFSRLFSKTMVQSSEIEGYYISIYNTRSGTVRGRIIKTKSKIIELNPGNLNDLTPLNEYLEGLAIECYGEKRSFYPIAAGL
jgi:hypothetical protein